MVTNNDRSAFSELDRISEFCDRWHIRSYDAFLKKAEAGMPAAIAYVRDNPGHEREIRRMLERRAAGERRAREEACREERRRAEMYGRTSDGEIADAEFWLNLGIPVDMDGIPLGIGDGY